MLISREAIKTFYNGLTQKMKQFRGNWNQNDSSADDYIKGRTHWEEIKTTVIIEEQTISGFALMQDPLYAVENPFMFAPNVGDTYTVTWDGVSYELEMVEIANAGGLVCIGNINYAYMEPGGNIPFAIIFAGDIFLVTESTAESHTISVSAKVKKIHKLDKKYLPDDVALSGKRISQLEEDVAESMSNVWYSIDDAVNNVYTVKNDVDNLKNNINSKCLFLTDISSGYEYSVQIKDGVLIFDRKPEYVMIPSMPIKTTYVRGEYFDPSGMRVTAQFNNNGYHSTRDVKDYQYSTDSFDTVGQVDFVISYAGVEKTIQLTVIDLDPATYLADFTYTKSGKYYILNGWNGTLNGEPSTELIIPNNKFIKFE